jgi:hypothetical protein
MGIEDGATHLSRLPCSSFLCGVFDKHTIVTVAILDAPIAKNGINFVELLLGGQSRLYVYRMVFR